MHPDQSVKLKGFSFMFIFNTRRTQGMFSGKDLNAPGCPRTGSHLQSIVCYLNSVKDGTDKAEGEKVTTYFFLLAFSAALVALPATSLGVVAWEQKE